MFVIEIKDAANKRVSNGHSTRGTLAATKNWRCL